MVTGISAINAVQSAAKKVGNIVKENKEGVIGAAGMAAGIGLYAAAYDSFVHSNDGETVVSALQGQDIAEKQGFIQKFAEQLKEKFAIDINNPPDGIDVSEPFMMDGAGHYIMDEYGAIINPWYNPDLLKESTDIIPSPFESTHFPEISMDSFLQRAAENADAASVAAGHILEGANIDVPDGTIDENFIQIVGKGIKHALEIIADSL